MPRRPNDNRMSPAEQKVYLMIVVRGMTPHEISEETGMALNTVKVHTRQIMMIKERNTRLKLAIDYYQEQVPRMLSRLMRAAAPVLLVLALLAGRGWGQQALADNMVAVCAEGCTITATSSPSAAFQFGVTGPDRFGPVFTSPPLPLLVDYGKPNLVLAPTDPADGVGKFMYAQRGAADYTVTWQGPDNVTQVTKIPALVAPPVVAPNSGFAMFMTSLFASFDVSFDGVTTWHCAIQNGAAPPQPPKMVLTCVKVAP